VAGEQLFNGSAASLEWVTPPDVHRAWIVFRSFQDKGWSFTDCVTRVVMERLRVSTAFAFDDHFRQFGTISVVP
jgi:predicted nucleic acid-binding protein